MKKQRVFVLSGEEWETELDLQKLLDDGWMVVFATALNANNREYGSIFYILEKNTHT